MSKFIDYINPTNWGLFKKEATPPLIKGKTKLPTITPDPGSRDTDPTGLDGLMDIITGLTGEITPEFAYEVIPEIRKLTISNSDFAQAIRNVINLGNTGHKITFDPNASPEQVDEMRKHLLNVSKHWAKCQGAAGMDGLVNKLLYQGMVAGAVAIEKVMTTNSKNLPMGLAQIPLVKPETIRWIYSKAKKRYLPYQKTTRIPSVSNNTLGLKKLNDNTFVYFGLYSDNETPVGIPPYLAALAPTATQSKMLDNIDFIVEQIGLIGFMQVLLDKPDKKDTENESQYITRMKSLLNESKANVSKGFRDGVNVGFKEDTEFEFHTATKSVSGVTDLFKENEFQVLSGLGMDGALMGRDYGSSESQITVVFTKMVSEFKNLHNIIAYLLQDIYTTELLLRGFKFDYLKVVFNPSTLLDDIKIQQALTAKIANVQSKWRMGIINQDQAAEELGYEKPDLPEPRVDVDLAKKLADEAAKKESKNTSAKKGRNAKAPAEKSPEGQKTRKKDQNSRD